MRIGILITFIGNFGQKGFYNSQEIGLAKALDRLADEVIIYKLVDNRQKMQTEPVEGTNNASLVTLPSTCFGGNGIPELSRFDTSLDVLVQFADTQLSVPMVYKWAQKNDVEYIPYIGVIESHSTSKFIRSIINFLTRRNLRIFKKCNCVSKTPVVCSQLQKLGVENCVVGPVGIDLSVLNSNFQQTPKIELKAKWQYGEEEKIVLFIGRMTEEKRPIQMIELFTRLYECDNAYRLLMVGKGELLDKVRTAAENAGLIHAVRFENQIPNADIWELYRIADCFVNLNRQEIFGMAILEAMYYGCKVAAWVAPGPNYIIENGVSGCLCESDDELMDAILHRSIDPEKSQERILHSFTWQTTGEVVKSQRRKQTVKHE